MPNARSRRSIEFVTPMPTPSWTPLRHSLERDIWESDDEEEENMPRRVVPEVDASTIEFSIPTEDLTQLEDLRRILATYDSQGLMQSITDVRRNSTGINTSLPRDMPRMNTTEIENALRNAAGNNDTVLRVWGTSLRQRYIGVRSYVALENDRFRIVGKMNGQSFCIVEDKFLHASPLSQSDIQGLRGRERGIGSRVARMYHDAQTLCNDEVCAKINDGYNSLVLRKIISVELVGDSLLLEVELFNVSQHMNVYLTEGVYIEYADTGDWRRASREQQIEILYSIGTRRNPSVSGNVDPTQNITTMEEFITYAHRSRRMLTGIKRDGTENQMQGIGPYIDNGFFATNMNDGLGVRFTTDLFCSLTDMGSAGHRSMNPMVLEHTLRIAMERGYSVDISFAGFLPDDTPRNFTLSRINSISPAYGGETIIITGNGSENGQQIALTNEHLEYVVLGSIRETPNVDMTEQEQITFLTEQVETLRAMVLEMSNTEYTYRELEREKNLANEVLSAKIALYGEDSRQVALARAEYDWLTAKVEAM